MFGFPDFDDPPMIPKSRSTDQRRFVQRSLGDLDLFQQRRPPQRDVRYISRLRLGDSSETDFTGRRRVQDVLDDVQPGDTIVSPAPRLKRIASMAVLSAGAKARPTVATAAKASAADRRYYNPDALPHAVTLFGTPARIGAAAIAASNQMRDVYKFYKSLTVVPCVQRAARREALFAFGLQGSHKTRRRRGPFSALRC